mgnify:CR=1 FL=1
MRGQRSTGQGSEVRVGSGVRVGSVVRVGFGWWSRRRELALHRRRLVAAVGGPDDRGLRAHALHALAEGKRALALVAVLSVRGHGDDDLLRVGVGVGEVGVWEVGGQGLGLGLGLG